MKPLGDSDAEQWCSEHGIAVSPSGRMLFPDQSHRVMALLRAPEASRRVALAHALLCLDSKDGDASDFRGCLIRITDMDIWSPALDQAGQRLLAAFPPVTQGATYATWRLDSGEFESAHALLVIPLLFDWDAYLVSASGDYVVFVSHDGPIEISTRTLQLFEETTERLESWGWELRERLHRPRS